MGAEFIQIFDALCCTRMILMKRMNSSLYSNYPGVIHPILSSRPKCGKKLNKCCSSNNTDDLCLSFSHCPPSTVFSVAEMEQGFIITVKLKKIESQKLFLLINDLVNCMFQNNFLKVTPRFGGLLIGQRGNLWPWRTYRSSPR